MILDRKKVAHLDRIWLIGNSDKLLEWGEHNKKLVRVFDHVLDRGLVVIGNPMIETVFQFERRVADIRYKVFAVGGQEMLRFMWDKETWEVTGVQKTPHFVQDCEKDTIQRCISLHTTLMAYMEHYWADTKLVKRKSETQPIGVSIPVHERRPDFRTKVAHRNVYQISVHDTEPLKYCVKETDQPVKFWNVKGHYRKLRDGRKVWVQPHVKGRTRPSPNTFAI